MMRIDAERIVKLHSALDSLVDTIVMTSNKHIDERMHAISEVQYYQSLLWSFPKLGDSDQKEFILQLDELVGEIGSWRKNTKE